MVPHAISSDTGGKEFYVQTPRISIQMCLLHFRVASEARLQQISESVYFEESKEAMARCYEHVARESVEVEAFLASISHFIFCTLSRKHVVARLLQVGTTRI